MAWGTTKTVASWSRRIPTPRAPSYPDPYTHPKPTYRNDVRCRIYLIYVLDPRTDYQTTILGYVGETKDGRELTRFLEHVGDGTASKPGQPWSDTIPERNPQRALEAGIWRVLDAVYDSKKDAWVAEEATVVNLRPLYNHEYNQHNPDRISIPDARRQRAERDRLNGLPEQQTWAYLHELHEHARHDAGGGRDDGYAAPARSWWPDWRLPRMTRANRRRAWAAVGWLTATLGLWWLACRYARIASAPRLGAVCGLLVALVMVWWTRPRRGPWRRLGNLLVRAVMAATMVYLLVEPTVHALLHHRHR